MKYFLIVLFSLVVSSNSVGQTSDNVNIKDEESIRKVLTDFADAWNKHDAKAFSMLFTEDADFTNVAGNSKRGRSEIEKHHEPGFKNKWKDSYQKITQSKIRFIKPDVAAVDAWWELTGIKVPKGRICHQEKGY